MNAMIRAVKGTLVVLALAVVGLGLRWMTDGAISGFRTYDFESMTVLAIGTVAWMAYGWLVLAVLMTVLEQLPGVVGQLASAVAGRITSTTARTLLRSGLGVAAVTPLTVTAAHAAPTTDGGTHAWAQQEPRSTVQLGATDADTWRATEPRSTIRLSSETPAAHPRTAPSTGTTNWRATEPPSPLRLTEQPTTYPAAPNGRPADPAGRRGTAAVDGGAQGSTEPRADHPTDSRVWATTEPASTVRLTEQAPIAQPADPASRQTPTPPTPKSTIHTNTPTPTQQPSDSRADTPTRPRVNGPTDTGVNARTGSQAEGSTGDSAGKSTGSRAGRPTGPQAGRSASDGPVGKPGGTQVGGSTGVPAGESAGAQVGGSTGSQAGRRTESRVGDEAQASERVRVGVPDRPAVGAATRYTDLRSGVPVRVASRVVVQEGDSLWSIAARELGPGASVEAIAARWPQWYAANRQVIGSDPNLVLPGQVLRIPAAATGQHMPPTDQEK